MRTIKFKMIIELTNGFIQTHYYDTGSRPVIIGLKKIIADDLQYVGLKDRNGNEIYDRTILRFLIDGKEYNEELYAVSYSEERACWQINCIKRCNHMDSPVYIARHLTQTLAACFEIAGNVFENPELKE